MVTGALKDFTKVECRSQRKTDWDHEHPRRRLIYQNHDVDLAGTPPKRLVEPVETKDDAPINLIIDVLSEMTALLSGVPEEDLINST